MSETTTRVASGWRFVTTRADDTLQSVAHREMGDAARWADLISLNGLVAPYLTSDAAEAAASGGKVRLRGESIRVFAPDAVASAESEPEDVFGADLALTNGRLTISNGDFALATGRDNLAAALTRRVITENGELLFHPLYGSAVRSLLGRLSGPAAAALAARSVRLSLERDRRVERVANVTAAPLGDRLAISATIAPIGRGPAALIQVEI